MANILIVDDDEMDGTLVRTLLAQEGHDTYLVSDGDAVSYTHLTLPTIPSV